MRNNIRKIRRIIKRCLIPSCPPSGEEIRDFLRHYLSGIGIEIGALDKPLDLTSLPVMKIEYVDRMSVKELRKQYKELEKIELARVDIIDDGEHLISFEPGSLDFIIANHFIEHAHNPMGTLENWLSLLKPGGVIFMAIPEKNLTFDHDRKLTALEHVITDYLSTPDERILLDKQHFIEWAELVIKAPSDQIDSIVEYLIINDYSIHFHTFTLGSFLEILNYLKIERKLPFEIKACLDPIGVSNEFVVVIKRL